jgi:glycosyltransferase involved in cell wall biosynthesis
MIYFTTKAFNAESTLRRAIESVLGQTLGDFRYHLCDNGSMDGTGDIIREYAKRDKRILPFINANNMGWSADSEKYVRDMMRNLEQEDWFSVLDADDDYALNFLEEMIGFVEEYDLDFAACRSDFIEEPGGNRKNEYILENSLVIEEEKFGDLFPEYFRFMGARWGKLQKGALFHRVDFNAHDCYLAELNLSHRSDTAAMLNFLKHSERAGVLAKLLHNYRQYPASHSRQNRESKLQDNYKMPEVYRHYLMDKAGFVSEENEKYIGEVFERSMRRTLL